MRQKVAVVLVIAIGMACAASGSTEDLTQHLIALLSSDPSGSSHFSSDHFDWQVSRVPSVTPMVDAQKCGLARFPAGSRTDWHPAQRKQYLVVLKGAMEIEASDGAHQRFVAGDVLLVTDTQGRGHRTSVPGDQELLLGIISIP